MELIDEIIISIEKYCTDLEAVRNILFITFDGYDIQKKQRELTIYEPQSNEAMLKKFLVCKKIQGCSDRTLKQYGMEIRKLLERIGKPVTDVTTDDIRKMIAYRIKSGVSKTTVNNEKRDLSSFFTWCTAENIMLRNPMLAVPSMKTPKTKKDAFKDMEIAQMRSLLKDKRTKCIFEILLSTGCRVNELINIRNDEIDGDTILVHGKGAKDRYVYLNAAALYALNQYQSERKDASEWLFPGGKPEMFAAAKKGKVKLSRNKPEWYLNTELVDIDKHVDAGTIERRIREIGRKCGVKAHPHKFRRTCATNALRSGMPVEMVSKMLGHNNISTTQIYLDLNENDLKTMHHRYVR